MIESVLNTTQNTAAAPTITGKPQKIFYMVENDRMAGSIPAWRNADPQNSAEHALSAAQNNASFQSTLDATLAYNAPIVNVPPTDDSFSFGDIVDMANPLHHIPLLGNLYRNITGDTIKPIGQIIGGAVFGGPLGAASGLVNTVIEAETGKDITGNALSMLRSDKESAPISMPQNSNTHTPDLPASLLSFTAQPPPSISNERTAPSERDINDHIREPITQLRLSGLYALAHK